MKNHDRYLQKRKENNGFDAQKFADWSHRSQRFSVGSIEENQVVHGDELRKIIDGNHVWISHVGLEFAFAVNLRYFAYPLMKMKLVFASVHRFV